MKKILFYLICFILLFLLANRVMAQSETSFVSSGTFINMAPTAELSKGAMQSKATELESLNRKVMKQFALRFNGRNIREEQWSYVSGGVEVTFIENNLPEMASFDDNGKWLFTISYLDEKQVPPKVREQIKSSFRSYRIFGVEAIAGPNTTVFLAHIQNAKSWKTLRIHNDNIVIEQDLAKAQ